MVMAVPSAVKGASTHKIPASMSTWTLRDFASPLTAAGPAQDAPPIKGKGKMWAGENPSHAVGASRHNRGSGGQTMGIFDHSPVDGSTGDGVAAGRSAGAATGSGTRAAAVSQIPTKVSQATDEAP